MPSVRSSRVLRLVDCGAEAAASAEATPPEASRAAEAADNFRKLLREIGSKHMVALLLTAELRGSGRSPPVL
jgi:hypothetical protein